jgi:hypothetical protein
MTQFRFLEIDLASDSVPQQIIEALAATLTLETSPARMTSGAVQTPCRSCYGCRKGTFSISETPWGGPLARNPSRSARLPEDAGDAGLMSAGSTSLATKESITLCLKQA